MAVEDIEKMIETEITPAEQPPTTPKDSGTPTVKAPEDPEFDLGVDDKGQPLKFKKSQILELQKGSMLQKDYTTKTQELATQREELKEMFGIIEHLKANPKKAERIIAILDEREEKVEEKIDEIDEILKTLDPNDPYAKTLMALRKQNQQLLKTTQDLQTKLGTFEQKTQAIEETGLVKQAEIVLTKALDDVVKTLKFEDDDDKADWRKMVLTYLINNPKQYTTEEEFLANIQTVGKTEYDALVKRNERVTARYIKAKGGGSEVPTHPAGGGATPLSKKPSIETLQEDLEEALKNEEAQST